MAKEKKPNPLPWLPTLSAKKPEPVVEDPETLVLLGELAEAIKRTDGGDLTEERFRRQWPSLHFRLRQWFGSLPKAFSVLLKRELGGPWSGAEVLGRLDTWFRTGEPMSLDRLMASDWHAARALVQHFGSFENAMGKAGLDPVLCSYDRRCDPQELAERGFLEWGFPGATVSESDILRRDPLFLGRLKWAAGSIEGFSQLVERWLEGLPELWMVHERGQVIRMPLRVWTVSSRGGRGRLLPGVDRVSHAAFTTGFGPGHHVCLASSFGRLALLDPAETPLVGKAFQGTIGRSQSWRKGERTVNLVAVGGHSSGLALVTKSGRMKVVQASQLARFKQPETDVLALEGSDRLVAAAGLPGGFAQQGEEIPERIAVVMKSGRVAVFPSDAVPWMTKLGKGTYRLSLARSGKDEAVAVVGLSARRSELVLVATDGRVRRVDGMALPIRRSEAQGIRVWPASLVTAVSGACDDLVWMLSKQGRLLAFPLDEIRQSKGGRQGVVGLDLHGGDTAIAAGCTPRFPTSEQE